MKDCCYPNCFECKLEDCTKDTVDYYEIIQQDKYDKELLAIEPEVAKRRKWQKKYESTQKAKDRRSKYLSSKKGKETQKRYFQTEKGKEAQKRYSQTQKGKDAQKRYYEKRKKLREV